MVPADCTDSETDAEYEHAIQLMERSVKADTTLSTALDLRQLTSARD